MGLRTDKLTAKAQKITIKLPWEVTTIYSEALKQSGHQSDDEEDEDDLEAQEASLERLKVTSCRVIARTIHLEPER
jgi:transcription initiation protein SPT3